MGHHEKETDRDPRPQVEEHDTGNQAEEHDATDVQPGSAPDRSAENLPDGSGTDQDERHEPEADRFDAG